MLCPGDLTLRIVLDMLIYNKSNTKGAGVGSNTDGFVATVEALDPASEAGIAGAAIIRLLHLDVPAPTAFAAADEMMHINAVRGLLDAAVKAASDLKQMRNERLYNAMIADELDEGFNRKGRTIFFTSTNEVTARDELGGRTNPLLHEWLVDHGMGNIIKEDINYQSLQSNVNEWLTKNPIEFYVNGEALEGEQLLDALAIDAEELEQRIADTEQLRAMVEIKSKPMVGMRKKA